MNVHGRSVINGLSSFFMNVLSWSPNTAEYANDVYKSSRGTRFCIPSIFRATGCFIRLGNVSLVRPYVPSLKSNRAHVKMKLPSLNRFQTTYVYVLHLCSSKLLQLLAAAAAPCCYIYLGCCSWCSLCS